MTLSVTSSPSSADARLQLGGARVLVIDDAPDLCRLYQIVLETSGAAVTTTMHAQEGITLALTTDYDVVLMDLEMPELSGLDAVTSLRRQGYQGTVLALSGHNDCEHMSAALAAGYSGYVTKSMPVTQLVDEVANWVSA